MSIASGPQCWLCRLLRGIHNDLADRESVFLDANILVYQILTIPEALIETAAMLSRQTGLLSDDALILAVMQAQ